MRVLVGTLSLVRPAGTETYVLTVAHELRRLGHEPVLWGEEQGPFAEEAERRGLVVARTEAELPRSVDAILANDGPSAARLAARYPEVRLVYVIHSDRFDVQLPPLVPGAVNAVVALSDRFAKRAGALALDAPLVRLTQPVDTEHFAPAGPLRPHPRRALLLGSDLRGERRDALVETWTAAGVRCVQVGAQTTLTDDPRGAIAEADIVVGRARAVLEGMACARAAYVYDAFGGDGWVTPATYPAHEADNFAGLASADVRDRARLRSDLERYDPAMGEQNRELVLARHGARRHAADLVDVLRGDGPAVPRDPAPLPEVLRLTRLAWDAERRSLRLEQELALARARELAAEERAEGAQAWAHASEARLKRVLDARRVRTALAAGRVADRFRGRR